MTDLTFCYLHMTNRDLLALETFNDTHTYLRAELADEELEIPPHMIPPNPDDSDILPSQVHPSYPYGNPTNIKHPAARPRPPHAATSRALFEDMGYAGGGVNGALRWKDLAMDILLPVDHEKEEAERAAQARKMASGASSTNNPPLPQTNAQGDLGGETTDEDEEEDEEDEDEDEPEDDDDDEDNIDENLDSYDTSFEDDV